MKGECQYRNCSLEQNFNGRIKLIEVIISFLVNVSWVSYVSRVKISSFHE